MHREDFKFGTRGPVAVSNSRWFTNIMRSGFNPLDVLGLLIIFVFTLKKIADMDRYHGLRVVVLTAILSCIVMYLLCIGGFMTAGITYQFDGVY